MTTCVCGSNDIEVIGRDKLKGIKIYFCNQCKHTWEEDMTDLELSHMIGDSLDNYWGDDD
jgi:hypothetical protein